MLLSEGGCDFVDFHVAIHEASFVEALDGHGASFIVHFDVGTTQGVAGVTIHDDAGGYYFTELKKEVKKIVCGCFFVEVTHENVHKNGF
jgi:hypothetical protein